MSIDVFGTDVLSLAEAAERFPRRPGGRKLHVSTLYRYARPGIRGVRLETVRVGRTLFTSAAAVQRFCDALTRLDDARHVTSPVAIDDGRRAGAASPRALAVAASLDEEGL